MVSVMNYVKLFFPEAIKRPVRRFLAPYRLRRSWLTRTVNADDNHLELYWNAASQLNRQLLIKILYEQLQVRSDKHSKIGVLEYGSHCGLNLKLLKEAVDGKIQIDLFAVEPNAEAVEFLKRKSIMSRCSKQKMKSFVLIKNFHHRISI